MGTPTKGHPNLHKQPFVCWGAVSLGLVEGFTSCCQSQTTKATASEQRSKDCYHGALELSTVCLFHGKTISSMHQEFPCMSWQNEITSVTVIGRHNLVVQPFVTERCKSPRAHWRECQKAWPQLENLQDIPYDHSVQMLLLTKLGFV